MTFHSFFNQQSKRMECHQLRTRLKRNIIMGRGITCHGRRLHRQVQSLFQCLFLNHAVNDYNEFICHVIKWMPVNGCNATTSLQQLHNKSSLQCRYWVETVVVNLFYLVFFDPIQPYKIPTGALITRSRKNGIFDRSRRWSSWYELAQ